jgi:ESF2/ABP1 family protein
MSSKHLKRKMPLRKVETPEESSDEIASDSGEHFIAQSNEDSENMNELDESDLELDEDDVDDGLEDDLGAEFELDEVDGMEANRQSLADLIAGAKATSQKENSTTSTGKTVNRGKGVVYISRIPPSMSHHQLRTLLAPYGEIGRIWIEIPETITQDKSLSKGKASKMARKMAKEGWVEFERAKKAYKTAKLLHCQPMGNGRFRNDLWSIKYLKDFGWNDLINQHLHLKKMRDERLRQSVSRAKQEATKFMENRNKQESLDNRKKRPRTDAIEVQRRTISMQEPQSAPSGSGLLGNDLLSKVRLQNLLNNLLTGSNRHTNLPEPGILLTLAPWRFI